MAVEVGAGVVDMECVQVHPTGIVDPKNPENKVKFLAAEALRGCGGVLLDGTGKRFCDELGKRDYVSGRMFNSQGPFRLILNSKAASAISWHCEHYTGRGVMKHFKTGEALAQEIGCSVGTLRDTFTKYNAGAKTGQDEFGKKFFAGTPFEVEDSFFAAVVRPAGGSLSPPPLLAFLTMKAMRVHLISLSFWFCLLSQVTPVVHYTMGGVEGNARAEVCAKGQVVPGLYAAGEVLGGVHGSNRLGGSSLLDCVVYGRIAGRSASKYLLQQAIATLESPA